MKRIFAIIFAALVLCGTFTVSAKTNIPNITQTFFVNDYADVISAADEKTMFNQGESLYNACKAQVVVATVNNMDGQAIEDYAYDMATAWELGDSEKDNGILLLLSVKDRQVRIEVGSGLEGALPDSKTGRILDKYGVDYFKDNRFSQGLTSVYNSLINEVYIEYGLEPDKDYEPVEDDSGVGTYIVLALIMLIVFSGFFRGRRGGGPHITIFPFFFGGLRGFGGGGGFGSSGGFGGGGFSGGGGGFSGGGSSRGF